MLRNLVGDSRRLEFDKVLAVTAVRDRRKNGTLGTKQNILKMFKPEKEDLGRKCANMFGNTF